ncbi:cytochrome c oxidase subunit 6A1, mitochondrial-like [Panthera pardus]|uniref:Cytochrome c oxidase subunit 6A1, mitochondrial-like n=1 Tax=Panthera pardus TaxID=9691 RepID=A0A9V1FNU2_PANPR|nr:cytochrome c oxidase subunit 6A1, mitochondrial-like [Panthera pardus]XP_042759178.1 cytochrome c oxidase subunit 6A1, mitochondrial-like [Panthera leo]
MEVAAEYQISGLLCGFQSQLGPPIHKKGPHLLHQAPWSWSQYANCFPEVTPGRAQEPVFSTYPHLCIRSKLFLWKDGYHALFGSLHAKTLSTHDDMSKENLDPGPLL